MLFRSTLDRTVNQLQQNVRQVLDPIASNPITSGNLMTGVVLATGNNTIKHGLNRPLQGWIICGQNAAASFYDLQATNQDTSQYLILNSSAAVTVSIYCF